MSEWQPGDLAYETLTPDEMKADNFDLGEFDEFYGVLEGSTQNIVALFRVDRDAADYTEFRNQLARTQ